MFNMLFAPEAADEAGAAAAESAAEAASSMAKAPVDAASPWSMPTQASTFADNTDNLYYFILGLDVLFFVLIIGAMVWFAYKYRRRTQDQKTSSLTHNGLVEFIWSAVPAVLLVVIFVWGEVDFVRQAVPPQDPLRVNVLGQKWVWTISYPDYPGVSLTSSTEEPVTTLVVPKDRPVRLTMTSTDVIHSFYVPAFRVKRDVIPGRYTNLWFEPTLEGRYNLFCTEYCGVSHSEMTGVVEVVSQERFESRIQELFKLANQQQDGETLAEFGERLYKQRCSSCHSVDGSDMPGGGPTWKGLFGKKRTFADGTTQVADEDYISKSIYEPQAQIVAGYANAKMPSFAGQLNDAAKAAEENPSDPQAANHILAIIEYMKTLK